MRLHAFGFLTAIASMVSCKASPDPAKNLVDAANVAESSGAHAIDAATSDAAAATLIALSDASIDEPACIRPRVHGGDNEAILSAVIPSYVPATHTITITHSSPDASWVVNCRGDKAPVSPINAARPDDAGAPAAVVLAQSKLGDGRLGVVIATSANMGACDDEEGFLAIVRLESERVIVDAVGPWRSDCRGPYAVSEHRVGGQLVWSESEGAEGSGAGTSEHQTLYRAAKGALTLLSKLLIADTPDCQLASDSCDSSKAHISFETDEIVVHEEQTHLTCHQDAAEQTVCDHPKKKEIVTRYHLVDGKLTASP
jgi:hypothetical protein